MTNHLPKIGDGYPPDWKLFKLDELGPFTKGAGITKSDLIEHEIPCVRYGEIYTTHDFVIKKFYSFISPEVAESSKQIYSGDILFAGSGETAEEIGKCVAYIGNERAYAGGDVIILRLKNGDPEYLGYLLNHEIVKRQKSRMGQGYSVVHIYSSHLKDVVVPLPPLPEQCEIAAILSTWDKAIARTERLIAALQARKKGLTQRLLTGEVRFPGFDGEWKHSILEDCCDVLDNQRIPLNSDERAWRKGTIPYWGANGILDYIDDFIFDEPLILMAEDGGYFEEARNRPICQLVDGKSWVNNHAHVLRAKSGVVHEWVYYWFVHRNIVPYINAGTRSKLNQKDLRKLPIMLPPYEEQKKISETLLMCDSEIKILEQKLNLIRKQKIGLMQRLLTGEVRVKVQGTLEVPCT